MNAILRRTDVFARYGGEEFALLMTQTPLSNAEKAADKLRQVIAEAPFTLQGKTVDVTLSCGLSCFVDGEIDTIDAMIMAADRALYRAKREGKNRVIVSAECLENTPLKE